MNGRQYVTVITGSGASGGGLFSSGNAAFRSDYRAPRRVLTFMLDGKAILPATEPVQPMRPIDDPTFTYDALRQNQGAIAIAIAFAGSGCAVCHGTNAVGGGSAPDLRTSPYIADRGTFFQATHGGALMSNGMPAFPELTPN